MVYLKKTKITIQIYYSCEESFRIPQVKGHSSDPSLETNKDQATLCWKCEGCLQEQSVPRLTDKAEIHQFLWRKLKARKTSLAHETERQDKFRILLSFKFSWHQNRPAPTSVLLNCVSLYFSVKAAVYTFDLNLNCNFFKLWDVFSSVLHRVFFEQQSGFVFLGTTRVFFCRV